MPDPQNTGTQPTIGATPTLTPQQLRAQQAAAAAQSELQAQEKQDKLQKAADKVKPLFQRNNQVLRRGMLIAFQYRWMKHDPTPLVLISETCPPNCTDTRVNGTISGLNMHYLTFKYVKWLINSYCEKSGFGYGLYKGNQYILGSYRSYRKDGRRQIKSVDCKSLLDILGGIRSYKPSEVEAMRKQVQEQLRQRMQQNADEMTQEYLNMIYTQRPQQYNTGKSLPHGNALPPSGGEVLPAE
jgi:hypothetical protein